MKIADDLLMSADLKVLYWVLGEIANKAKEDNDLVKVLLQLEQFVEIHKVRTNDMVTYRDKIEIAREEYRSLSQKYKGMQELLKQNRELLSKVMNEKMNEDVDYEF